MPLRAVLFDVDFTIAKPGPDLGPEGYQRLGSRFGLELDPASYADARARAVETLERHPELDHDDAVSSGRHGKTKPHPTIFRAALDLLDVEPADTAMVGDSIDDDVEGAR